MCSASHVFNFFLADASDILCEFLEVAVHFILYMREVYPAGIFKKRLKYNVAVQVDIYSDNLVPNIIICHL